MKINSKTLRFEIETSKELREVHQIVHALEAGHVPLESNLVQSWQKAAGLSDEAFAQNYHALHISLLSSMIDYYENLVDQIQDFLPVDLFEMLEE